MKYLTRPVMACVPFLICGAPIPSGPLAIESKIPDVGVLQNLLLANTCILHSGRIVATPGRSFFGAGSAEIPRLRRFRCWKNRLTFGNPFGEPGKGNHNRLLRNRTISASGNTNQEASTRNFLRGYEYFVSVFMLRIARV
jgi:hypothetical protein